MGLVNRKIKPESAWGIGIKNTGVGWGKNGVDFELEEKRSYEALWERRRGKGGKGRRERGIWTEARGAKGKRGGGLPFTVS